MKKLFLSVILITNITLAASFSNIKNWYPITIFPEIKTQLKVGDIILFKPLKDNILQSFGHAALIGEDHKIVDFPSFKTGFREMPFDILATGQFRELAVLRYKHMTNEFKEKLLNEMYSRIYKKYFILSFPKISKNTTYCSLFVYNVYEDVDKTKQEIFPPNSGFILPADFIDAGQNFNVLNFIGENKK